MLDGKKSVFKAVFFAAVCLLGTAGRGTASPVVLDVAANLPVVEAGKSQTVIVRALVRPHREVERRRVPLAVALVLDRSGSMASDGKMENAKRGAMGALEMLGSLDVATVVVYDSRASVLVPARPASEGKTFSKAVSRIRAGGSTALYDGVRIGAEQLEPFVEEGYVPRIILLSDGMANVGPSSTRDLAQLGRILAGREMTITTIGLGLDYNEDLMTALASESGGNAYFARDAAMLPEIFARDMEDAVTLTARKVRVTLTCGDEVRPVRVVGRGGEKGERSLEVAIDNLYGTDKYALFEVEVPDTEKSSLEAATVRLEYLDPDTGAISVQETALRLVVTRDTDEVAKNRNADIASQAELARNAEIREEVVRLADIGDVAEASKILKQRTEHLREMAPAAGVAAPKMEAEASYFDSLAESLQERGRMSNSQRKATLNEAYMQKNQQAGTAEKPDDDDVK